MIMTNRNLLGAFFVAIMALVGTSQRNMAGTSKKNEKNKVLEFRNGAYNARIFSRRTFCMNNPIVGHYFCDGGKSLLLVDNDGVCALFKYPQGEKIMEAGGKDFPARDIRDVSADGKFLLFRMKDEFVILNMEKKTWQNLSYEGFSFGAKYLQQNNSVLLWDETKLFRISIDDPKKMTTYQGAKKMIRDVAVSPDESFFLTIESTDAPITQWDTKEAKIIHVYNDHKKGSEGERIAFLPGKNDEIFSYAAGSGTLFLNLKKKAKTKFVPEKIPENGTNLFHISPDGKSLMYSAKPRGQVLYQNGNSTSIPYDAHFMGFGADTDDCVCYKRSESLSLSVLKIKDLSSEKNDMDLAGELMLLTYGPDGKHLISSNNRKKGLINYWTPGKEDEASSQIETHETREIGRSPDGKTLLIPGHGKSNEYWLSFYDVKSKKILKKEIVEGNSSFYEKPAVSADEKYWSTIIQGTLQVFERGKNKAISRLVDSDGINHYVLMSENNRVAAIVRTPGKDSTAVAIWDMTTGQMKRQFGLKRPLSVIAAFPDGKQVAVGGKEGQIWICETETGNTALELFEHKGEILCLALSSNGKTLYSTAADGSIRIWDIEKGKQTDCIDNKCGNDSAYKTNAVHFALSPSEKEFAVGNADTSITVYKKME